MNLGKILICPVLYSCQLDAALECCNTPLEIREIRKNPSNREKDVGLQISIAVSMQQ